MLEPIEPFIRPNERLDQMADLVIRGWPLNVEGLLRNADHGRSRFSWHGQPLVAVSVEATVNNLTLDDILSGPRLRVRRRYAKASAAAVLEAGFRLVPTFVIPHYSVVLPAYTEQATARLLGVLGEVYDNPHYLRRTR